MSDNGKTNQNGRIDVTAILRHVDVERCPIGALALYLFFIFDVLNFPIPPYDEAFVHPINLSQGHEWFYWYLFPGNRKRAKTERQTADEAEPEDRGILGSGLVGCS